MLKALTAALPQARRTAMKKTSRKLLKLRHSLTGTSEEEQIRSERKLRGREQYKTLRKADVAVVSYGKSGRTWLRVMISRLYQQVYDLPPTALLGFGNFHFMNRDIPRIFFTHDNYIGDYTGNTDSKRDFYGTKAVLMVRDPRDVAVSQFFQWKYRMRPEKKTLNDYPPDGTDISVYDFVMKSPAGLQKVIDFMDLWAREMQQLPACCVVRYEDMLAEPVVWLKAVAQFLEIPADDAQIRDAVDYASYDNMKKMESEERFQLSGGRMKPRDKSNPNSYKVRRAKAGGYKDYFDADQIREIDAYVKKHLNPVYKYE
jgi:alcohol sulfotransferase